MVAVMRAVARDAMEKLVIRIAALGQLSDGAKARSR
jgi:hypothetical protein